MEREKEGVSKVRETCSQQKHAAPDEIAKISVLRAKTPKFGFVVIYLMMKDNKGQPFLYGAEE